MPLLDDRNSRAPRGVSRGLKPAATQDIQRPLEVAPSQARGLKLAGAADGDAGHQRRAPRGRVDCVRCCLWWLNMRPRILTAMVAKRKKGGGNV